MKYQKKALCRMTLDLPVTLMHSPMPILAFILRNCDINVICVLCLLHFSLAQNAELFCAIFNQVSSK